MKKKMMFLLTAVLLMIVFSVTAFAYDLGDVNGDGNVNALDARLALRYSAKLAELDEEQLKAADVDRSGVVNAIDARSILRVAAQLDIPFKDRNIDKYLVEEGVLNVAVEDNMYPFSYVEDGEIKGYNIDLFKKIEDYYDVKVKFHIVKKYQMLEEVGNGKYDIALQSEDMVFDMRYKKSDILYSNEQNAVILNENYISSIYNLKEMTGIKIGVIKNSLAEKILLKDKELGVLKADSIVGYSSCYEGNKALENKEIYAFVTDLTSANYMSNVDNDKVKLSVSYNNENYLFFGDPESGELVDLLSKVINGEQAEKIVDKHCHYDAESKIIASSTSVNIAPGGSAIIVLETKSFYAPPRLYLHDDMGCPYAVVLKQNNIYSYDKYYVSISVPANAKSGYVTIGTGSTSEDLEVKIRINVTSADGNYHINGKTDIPDFGAMTKTHAEVFMNGNENIFYTYTASQLNKNKVTVAQARKYYDKLRANGFKFVLGYNDGYRFYENKTTGETIIYREYYNSAGKLDRIVVECIHIDYLK